MYMYLYSMYVFNKLHTVATYVVCIAIAIHICCIAMYMYIYIRHQTVDGYENLFIPTSSLVYVD